MTFIEDLEGERFMYMERMRTAHSQAVQSLEERRLEDRIKYDRLFSAYARIVTALTEAINEIVK